MVSRVEARKGLEQILADKAAAREEIEALGGMNLKTGIQNLLAGYNFSSGPRIETTRRRDGTETDRIVDGYQLPSSLPDRPEDKGLELGTPYYDFNRGEFVYYTRSEPTRNRPQGMLKKNIIAKNLEQKERISKLIQQGSSLDDIGKAIGIAEMGALIPAAGKAAVKFAPYAARKLGDIASDIRYGDTSFSATRGILPEPAAGVGADVVKTEGTFLESLDKNYNFITSANRTSPKTKAVTVGDQDTIIFNKKATQEEIIEQLPVGPEHKKLLEMNPAREISEKGMQNLKFVEGYKSPITPEMQNEVFLYMQKLMKEGYTFQDIAKMDKIFPQIYLGRNTNGSMKAKNKYLEWAKSNDLDLFPEHNAYNRLEYNPDKVWFGNSRSSGFSAGNAQADAFINYIKTGDETFLSSNAAAKFYVSPKGQIDKVTKKTVYGVNEKINGKTSSGLNSAQKAEEAKQIRQYITEVLIKSDDPQIQKFLGDNPTQAVDDLFTQQRNYVNSEGRLKQTYALRQLNQEPQFMQNIHNAVGKDLAEGTFEFNEELLREIMTTTGLTDPVEANKMLFKYISMHRGTYNVPGFDKRLLNKNIGALLEDISEFEKGFGEAINISPLLDAEIGKVVFGNKNISFKQVRENIGTQLPEYSGKQVDEILSRRTAVQTGNEINSIFIQPLDETVNTILKGRGTDSTLGKALKVLKQSDGFTQKEFNEVLKKYRLERANLLEQVPGIYLPEPVFGKTIPAEQLGKIEARFGKAIANKFSKAAQKNGYYFKYTDDMQSVLDPNILSLRSTRAPGVIGGNTNDMQTGDNIFQRALARGKEIFEPVEDLEQLSSVKKVQEDIKTKYKNVLDQVQPSVEKKIQEIRADARDVLRNERPVKFKASEFTNLAEEFVFKPAGTLLTAPAVGALNAIEFAYNKSRQGVENDIDMQEKFPHVYKLFNYYTSGIGPTPDEQTYIGFIDETIRSVQKGGQNLTYGILDLAATIPDFAFNTEIQERLQKAYNENAFADPETFLGDVGAILTEFGVPGTVAFKFINFIRRGLGLADKSTEGMKLGAKLGTQISNVSKRVATVGGAGFLGEFVGGSPYNSVTRMSPDDPLLFDDSLADITGEEKYRYIDTTGMSGKELTLANLTNRIRFGTEGAIVGGLFPIVGPALWKTTKYGAIKPAAYVAGKGLQAVNYLGIKPVSYLLARTPGVAQVGQGAAMLTGMGASFLGKDVISRAVIGMMGTPTLKQLPEFKQWRMFEVTSTDPLERNLKKYDNFLGLFRDTANQSANRFFITGQTSRSIKAISRKIEKQLDIVEKRAYDLQRGFLKDYNSKTTSPAKQEYYLDQVLAYLKGQIKLSDLPEVLQEGASALNKTFIQIKKEFADVLPDGAGLKDFLMSNLKSYSRASFATFTNPLYRPDRNTYNKAVDFMVDRIKSNASMVDAALAAARPGTNSEVAVKDFARKQIESILQRGKVDNRDPLDVLQYIARENLKMDDLVVQTGEELPDVIRKLMGEENNLRASVMTTATDLASQTANLQMYDKLTDLGLREGWLFRSADEAIAAGVVTPKLIGPRLPGLGKLNSKISEAYGGEDIVNSIVGSTGLLDGLLKNEIYQSLIAYKAMVQSGKTVYSPATQTRNFGSAGFFPLQSGHVGGAASVQDAFKIILDDVFGAGKTLNEQQLIDRITKKIELGVLDENVVVSELKEVLKDLKASNFKSFGQLAKRVDETKLSDTATRLYAGGDNVWKWYGHEFVMSQLKNGFKSIDEIKDAYKSTFKVDIDPKTIEEGIEQYAATLIRDTYPTYSKVPKLIQYIRRIPFIGNFVSFPAEILRTTFTTSALAAKHIASNNAALRELGYRTLIGQYLTYGGIGLGTTYLGKQLSNMTDQQMKDLKMYFAPEFMRNSDLIPITPMKDGVVKVFDNSRYFPYDLITATVGNLMNRVFTSQEKLDPDEIETDMFKDLYNYTGPFADLAGGTLFGTAIGFEPALTFLRGGKTKTGSSIYAKTDTTLEKFDKMFAHTFETINPGFVRTLQNMYKAFAGMLTGTGQPIKPEDELFKLWGGSAVTLDVSGSFRYKIGNLKSSFREPKVSEGFFNPDFRTGDQLAREYNEQNEEAFREQYEFFKLVRAAKRSNFMTDVDMIRLLKDRVGTKTATNILSGRFTPLSYSKDALRSRYENVKRGNPNETLLIGEFLPFAKLEAVKNRWKVLRFEDFEREQKEPIQPQAKALFPLKPDQESVAQDITPQPLPDTPDPNISAAPPVDVNPLTGLTTTETALLSPGEQAIRQRQKGMA